MPKVGNKTINYSVYDRSSGRAVKIDDTTSIQLPSLEMLTDTIKGSGIIGEIDWPTFLQPGSMGLTISTRVIGDNYISLATARDLEIRWVTDQFESSDLKTGVNAHKAFIKCIPKKMDEGKLEPGAAQDGSFEYEVWAYKRIVNGKEVVNIDKFNGIFSIGGKNLAVDFSKYL